MPIDPEERFAETFTTGTNGGGAITPEFNRAVCVEVVTSPKNEVTGMGAIDTGILPTVLEVEAAGIKVRTEFEASLTFAGAPAAAVFSATTVTSYMVPEINPTISQLEVVELHELETPFPIAVATYLEIAEPPLLSGGSQFTEIFEPDTAVETLRTLEGADGSITNDWVNSAAGW